MLWVLLVFPAFIGWMVLNDYFLGKAYQEAVDKRGEQYDRLEQAFHDDRYTPGSNVENIHASIDDIASESVFPSVCSAGCSHCCYQAIDAFRPEIPKIQSYVAEMPTALKQSIAAEAAEWVRDYNTFFKSHKFWDGAKYHGDDPSLPSTHQFNINVASTRYEEVVNQFNDERPRKCPFLQKGLCSIYPVRPSMCRAHFQTENPDACAENHLRKGAPDSIFLLNVMFSKFGGISMGAPLLHAVHKELGLEETMLGMDGLERYAEEMESNPYVDDYIFPARKDVENHGENRVSPAET